ncbi:MAG TPA: regulator [Bacillus bacterium]|uniref:BofC protein n=1 Tax=Siminovitchia fordii TaxID=254759 RepID=A0ABQ4KAA6_9BACI|nr:BofC C-terminal domain-containing protein [Siminovitchia fordii]GIN22657.1 BofC protein [Siminovitchia fordii]HBZ09634.1 regulator [Bacillus sp. (in: firmicutes)]
MRAVLAFTLLIGLIVGTVEQEPAQVQAKQTSDDATVVTEQPLELTVHLKRVYLDGEESEEVVKELIFALEDFWAKYETWQLVDMDEDRLIFEKKIDDISPLLKMNGYFGITDDGTLSLFNGKPEESDVIQSFFQIDVKKLESSQHMKLMQGIPVKSKEKYTEVVESMKKYSIEKAQ